MRTSSTRACSCCRRRQYRFPHRGRHGIGRTFFTGVDPREVIANLDRDEEGFVLHDAWQDIQAQLAPVTPEGYGGSSNVEELQSQARIRGQHAQAIVEDTFRLLADDFLNGARWLDVRKTQDRTRDFGRAPTAAWEAFRKAVPLVRRSEAASARPGAAYEFIRAHAAEDFAGAAEPFPIREP